MADSSNPVVSPTSPQTNSAIKVSDPTFIDDTASFSYAKSFNFTLTGFKTLSQGSTPQPFTPPNYIPSSAPFIIELDGSGFALSNSVEPFKIYITTPDGYIAHIPPLSSSTNLSLGIAFGYVIKSDTSIWVYLNRMLFSKIWFTPPADISITTGGSSFNGIDSSNTFQLESGNGSYSYLDELPVFNLYMAVNSGLINKPDFFTINNFKSTELNLTQTPFIVAVQGIKKNNAVFPIVSANGSASRVSTLNLFGHGLYDNNTQRSILLVPSSSSLLTQNPSVLPASVLTADQSANTIQNMKASDLAAITFFKAPYFLSTTTQTISPNNLSNYNYFNSNGQVVNSGLNGYLPDSLPITSFSITALPTGNYYVVSYDQKTGVYSTAPDTLTYTAFSGFQIHDISPQITTLQKPIFVVNGFNFPQTADINNGTALSVSLVDSNGAQLLGTPTLTITSSSPTKDAAGNGSIELTSPTQIKVNFSTLNYTGTLTTAFLKIQAIATTANGIDDTETSTAITVQAQPVISFLTNAEQTPPDNSKSLVRIDQNTGKIIAYNTITNDLYIVGKNFGNGKNVEVLIGGQAQTIKTVKPWSPDNSLQTIQVAVNSKNINSNVSVEVKINGISTEPFIIPLTLSIPASNITTNAKGSVVKAAIDIPVADFTTLLPYSDNTLLNSANTSVSSSIAVKLSNITTKQAVNLSAGVSAKIQFIPNIITIAANTPVLDGNVQVSFNFTNIWGVDVSSPKIVALIHNDGSNNTIFKPAENMIVAGTGFIDGMRYNINKTKWLPAGTLFSTPYNGVSYQAFSVSVPASNSTSATIQISHDQASVVAGSFAAGTQNGSFQVSSLTLNDNYAPLLQINQRLPAGIKLFPKGSQAVMTDKLDANMSIYGQMTPFLSSFKTLLIIIRVIVCIIDVICALINPFQLITAIIALMDCIIDLLSLFPQLAVPIMILSFLQNFIGFIQTFIPQIEAYAFSLVNAELAIVKAKLDQDFAALSAGEQQAFAITKQINDAVALLQPALQIIQIFKDLLTFAMHFPCASNQGSSQGNGCPPQHIQDLIDSSGDTNFVQAQLKKAGLIPGQYPNGNSTLNTMFCQAVAVQTATLNAMAPGLAPGSTAIVPSINPTLPDVSSAIECFNTITANIQAALNAGNNFITTPEQGQQVVNAYLQCANNLLAQTIAAMSDMCGLAVSGLNSDLTVSPRGAVGSNLSDDFVAVKIPLPSTSPTDSQDAGLTLDLAKLLTPASIPSSIATDPLTGSIYGMNNFGTKQDIYTPIIIQTNNKSGQRQSKNTIYFNAENDQIAQLISVGDILEIVGGTFSGLQFPILAVEPVFSSIRLTTKLDITFEQKLLVGEQMIPENLNGFDVKVIAHLAGNDAIAVVPADNTSLATIQIMARDHHGHLIGSQLANNIAVNIDSGDASFVPVIPSSTTDLLGIIQEQQDYYIANLKSDCAGVVIVSASMCGIDFVDIGYYATDDNHTIQTRKKTVKILFTPPLPGRAPQQFTTLEHPQVSGTHFDN